MSLVLPGISSLELAPFNFPRRLPREHENHLAGYCGRDQIAASTWLLWEEAPPATMTNI